MPNTANRPFYSAGVRLDGIIDVFVLLGLSGSWLGLLGRWHWALDLFSHFRWQYLVISVFAILWSASRKRKALLAISVATALLNGALIGRLAATAEFKSAALAE